VELRFGVSDGAPQELSNLAMLIPFHLVEVEDLGAPRRRSGDGAAWCDAINGSIRLGTVFPSSRFSEAESPVDIGSSRDTSALLRHRSFIRTVFTAILYSQEEKPESPRNELML
jgi:hypothetical protein